MQVAESVSMATAQIIIIMQFFADLEKNNISKAGCRWLSKANWKLLDTIKLGLIEII